MFSQASDALAWAKLYFAAASSASVSWWRPCMCLPLRFKYSISRQKMHTETRAVQRFILSLFSNMVQGSEGANEKENSQEAFSLNLFLATASAGGRHEVIRTFSFAARNDPRPTPRRGQTL